MAGRASGGDRYQPRCHPQHGLLRGTGGQGAGIAAALSLHTDREVTEIDITKVHSELERQGVRYR